MTKGADGPSGLLLIDKPAGMTSHDVVRWARRALGTSRVGHAGTLDPLASGLLPCLAGPATRLVQYLHGWSKTYVGVIALGEETATGDAEAATGLPPAPLPPKAVLDAARARLTGTYLQVPPAYSAKKIGGERAHRLARRGYGPVMLPSSITVHRLRFVAAGPGQIAFAARVGSGTYLRSLARDLGRILGTGAHLAALRRTSIGPLRVRGAVRPDPALPRGGAAGALVSLAEIPLPFASVRLDAGGAGLFTHGRAVAGPRGIPGPRRVEMPDGALAGIGLLDAAGRLLPDAVLAPRVEAPADGSGRWFLPGLQILDKL